MGKQQDMVEQIARALLEAASDQETDEGHHGSNLGPREDAP
jgi:hypothetical protein